MLGECSTKKSLSFKFLLNNSRKHNNLSKITDYLESKKTEAGFPILVFADHIPTQEELTQTIIIEKGGNENWNHHILALRDIAAKQRPDYWQLLQMGFDDIIEWDSEDEMIDYIQSKINRNRDISEVLESPLVAENLVGNSIVWKTFLSDIIEATLFSQASILLIGESGTGKELISRLIHTIDRRPDKKKLIIVDCTTIVSELSGSELFGHERGSYTNAVQSREGAVALANGGTLFLDEVGELPLNLQAELLRVLQEGTYKKVGSNQWQKTSFRLVCATNRDLRREVEEGRFRQDLYFRIADCEFYVPSLRKRKDDIPCLVNYFLTKLFPTVKPTPVPDKTVLDYLIRLDYPGNVRQLKQLLQRIALKHVDHKKITIGEVPLTDRLIKCNADKDTIDNLEGLIRKALLTGEDWWLLKDKISETAIRVALELENNNKQKAAERLGVDVRTVQQYVKKKG